MFNERQVVSRVLDGDLKAFEQLVKQYERLVLHVISRLVSRKEDKEDICQEVFIKVHKSLSLFAFKSKLSTWVARIAYLTAINYIRKNAKHEQDAFTEDIGHFHFTNENPEQLLTRKNMSNYLERLIAQMPGKYRIVVTLYHLDEFSCAEIEAITGIPEGTVKSYLFRARKLLKEKIENHFKPG
jgi:RNA polymerase sigma-70 factor (ECF subfamily)